MDAATIDPRYLDVFPRWLEQLGKDMASVGDHLAASSADDEATRALVSGINYVFKSLDLIPDGMDDIGYIDDAFVLRVACAQAAAKGSSAEVVARLAEDAGDVQAFLGASYEKLDAYVRALRKGAARGRTVEDVVTDAEVRTQLLQEVKGWAEGYQVPTFTRDPKTLARLKAFLDAKL